jgi:IS5 family transposase
MTQERYAKTRNQSFYGDYLYEMVVPQDHFFRVLKDLIDWSRFTNKLIKLYQGEGVVGRPPFDPGMILKIELVAYLYNLSERQVEEYLNDTLSAKYFVGLAVDQPAPDHSTLTVFRNRLIQRGKQRIFEEMLAEIVQIALEKGVKFGSIQIIDSVHSIANVNTAKDKKREDKGKGPRDPDAKWGVKHQRKVKTPEGKEIKQTDYFYGYKAHVSMNAETGLISSLETTPGRAFDGHHFCSLVDKDLKQSLPLETYAGDKGYDDSNNHFYLDYKGLHSAIRLKDNRIKKKDENKEVWLNLIQTPEYRQGLKERYKIERKFGEAKQGHGLGRCRYTGIARFTYQAFITAMVLNLKRMVRLLTGVGFKTKGVVTN